MWSSIALKREGTQRGKTRDELGGSATKRSGDEQ